jgi:hypothetical protein
MVSRLWDVRTIVARSRLCHPRVGLVPIVADLRVEAALRVS